MNFQVRLFVTAIFFAVACSAGAATSAADSYLPDEILVQLKPAATLVDRKHLEALLGPSHPLHFRTDILRIKIAKGLSVPNALELLKGNAAVEVAQPNYRYSLFQSCSPPPRPRTPTLRPVWCRTLPAARSRAMATSTGPTSSSMRLRPGPNWHLPCPALQPIRLRWRSWTRGWHPMSRR